MALKTATAIIPDPDNPDARIKIIATYGINDRIARQSPYITVSGEAYKISPSGRTAREPYCWGQIVDEIANAFPWLAPLMALHSSDAQTGAPIHALANGWYFLNGEPDYNEPGAITEASRIKAANYLRTSPDVLAKVRSKSDLAELIDNVLGPAWKLQAESVLVLLGITE